MAHALRTPDYEGGFITKEVKDGWVYTYDNNGDMLNVQPVNYVHRGVESKYGRIIDYSEGMAALQKGNKTITMNRGELNNYLQKSLDSLEFAEPKDKISGTFNTAIGKIKAENQIRQTREILTLPDKILINKKTAVFEKSINGIHYSLMTEKGIIKRIYTEKKKIKLMFKGVAATAEPAEISTGNGWNQRGGMKPGHKYIQRKEAGTKPDGSPKYIYLYQLPNGEKQWKDENGKPVEQKSGAKEYSPKFEAGEMVKQGDKVGKVLESSDNFMAVNFEGNITIVNKNEHLDKIKEHQLYKEGDETTYEKQPAKILKVTDNMALIKTLNDNRLRVISLEKQFQKIDKKQKKEPQATPEPTEEYSKTPEYSGFIQATKEAGLGKLDDLTARKFIKVGKTMHSVEWKYDPAFKEVRYFMDGQEDKRLDFMGETFKVRDVTDKGWSLENSAGETGLFLSHKDYEKGLDEKGPNFYKDEIIKTDDREIGELIHSPKRTFTFSGKLNEEQLKKAEAEKEKLKPSRKMVIKRKEEPLQTEAQKAAIEAERANKQAQIKEALSSKSYADFDKAMKERDFEVGENKFTANKKVEIGGKKFEVSAKYKPEDGVWETSVSGPHETLKMGDKSFPITDVNKDKVYYQDGADEKAVSLKDLENINGKSIFEPTKASKGIISNLPPQRIYFGLNDNDAAAGYYEIVDAKDITASHLPGGEANKNYTISDAQNRDRSTPQSLAQINKIAANPNFDFLSDSKTATDGAPVVNQDYNVIAGNGRTIGMQQHYENGSQKYKQDLLNNAEKLGFKRDDIDKIKNPVLVRRMNIDNKEAQRLGAMSNTSNMLATEAREEAKGKATRIDDKTFNNLAGIFEKAKGERNSISEYLDEVGPEIVKELVSKHIIPENEQHLYFNTTTGKLDASHKDKVKELLTQSILGESSKEFEKIPDAAREGMSKSLGDIFSLKGKEGDLVPHLQNAVKILAKYNAVKDRFSSPDDFIAQDSNNAFEKLSGSKEDLALFELMTSGKPNEIKNKIREYKQAMEGDMFGEGLSPEEAFNKIFKPKYEKGINKSIWSRIKLFGRKFSKSIDTAQLQLFPSKKNPQVKRWQNLHKEQPQEKPKEPAQPFYYKSEKIINEKMPISAYAEQVKGIIADIPEAEKKWLGIDDYLNMYVNEKINKTDILDFIKDNELKIEEVKKEGVSSPAKGVQQFGGGSTKYSEYTFPGGDNYREILFILPNKEGLTAKEYTEFEKLQQDKKGWQIAPEQVERYNELAGKAYNDRQESFKSSHWDEPNTIAHARVDDRIDINGKTVFFVEEVQSDYALELRKRGSREQNTLKLKELYNKVTEINKRINEYDLQIIEDTYKITKHNLEYAAEKIPIDIKTLRAEILEFERNKYQLNNEKNSYLPEIARLEKGVPDMPFRNNWHEFLMKRLLREAAEEGYDQLAWTTGAQQAERYDLSKQIDEIKYKETFPGMYEFIAVRNGGDVLTKSGLNKNQLEEYLGKDAAQKIIDGVEANNKLKSDPTKNAKEFMRLSGNDLKIGGEWAKNLYDKIIPEFLNKYGKKWGAKVGESEIVTDNHLEKYRAGEIISKKNDYSVKVKVHSIDITPDMRTSILYEGQPMFGKSKRLVIFGKKFLQKSIDTTKNILLPSKKNPNVQRWQNINEAYSWIDEKTKEYGSRNKFLASEEYRNAYGEIKKLYNVDRNQYAAEAEQAMQEAGAKYGDKVEYSAASPFGEVFSLEGVIVNRNGIPYVKLDQQTIDGKKTVKWHKGFKKVVEKSIDTTKNVLMPSKKNPTIKRWQTQLQNKLEESNKQVETPKENPDISDMKNPEGKYGLEKQRLKDEYDKVKNIKSEISEYGENEKTGNQFAKVERAAPKLAILTDYLKLELEKNGQIITNIQKGSGGTTYITAYDKSGQYRANTYRVGDHIGRGSIFTPHADFRTFDDIDTYFNYEWIKSKTDFIKQNPIENTEEFFNDRFPDAINIKKTFLRKSPKGNDVYKFEFDLPKKELKYKTDNGLENPPKADQGTTSKAEDKQPYEMTRDEVIRNSEIKHANETLVGIDKKLVYENDTWKQKIHGEDTRKISKLNRQKKEWEKKREELSSDSWKPNNAQYHADAISHKRSVEQALKEGKTVPEEVLKDYPDLVKKDMQVVNAADFAKEKHKDQKYNGKDYFDAHISKVVEKSNELANSLNLSDQLKKEITTAAYLHDTLEDTDTTYDEVESKFGKNVADIVLLLSHKLELRDGKRRDKVDGRISDDEYYRGISKNLAAKVVKTGDRLVNISLLKDVQEPERKEKLYDKYKGEEKYFKEYDIFSELIEEEFDTLKKLSS